MIYLTDASKFEGFKYPEQLNGAWFYYVFFENHPNKIDGICCIYFNDKHPSGSVFTGKYILNEYPDAYSTWGQPDEDGNVESGRAFVSPVLRNRGIAIAAGAYGMKMLKDFFNKTVNHLSGNEIANKSYSSAAKLVGLPKFENPELAEGFHMTEEYFSQPVYPYVFFGKRVAS